MPTTAIGGTLTGARESMAARVRARMPDSMELQDFLEKRLGAQRSAAAKGWWHLLPTTACQQQAIARAYTCASGIAPDECGNH